MHTPNSDSRGHTFVLFPASGNVIQKSQDSIINETHSPLDIDTQKWKGWIRFYWPGKSGSDFLQQIKRITKALHIRGVSLQSFATEIPLERRTLNLLHLLHPDLEYRDI
ncbi:hypothetical protein GW17_00036357 [Ensete ventricosum]|nr:hypothetical protein GW17_00036357 [Ensete ventricosum]